MGTKIYIIESTNAVRKIDKLFQTFRESPLLPGVRGVDKHLSGPEAKEFGHVRIGV